MYITKLINTVKYMLKIDGYLPVFNGVENCALMDYKQTFKQYCCMWGDSKTTFFI